MDGNMGIVVGIDIAHDYTQISYYMTGMNEPESMSTIYNEQKYLIPTVLFKWNGRDQWIIGDDAMLHAGRHEGDAVDDLLEITLTNRIEILDGQEYKAEDIFNKFMEQVCEQIKKGCNCQKIHGVGVTIEYPDRVLIERIYSALERCGIDKENIRVIGHSEALLYYIVNQKKELWVNDVAMFDYSREHFMYRRVSQVRGRVPTVLKVDEYDFTTEFPYDGLKTPEGRNEADEKLLSLIQKDFRAHIVSAVYLTGIGFYDEDWIDKSLPYLCNKRRVFKGHNLCVKGACYSIMEKLQIISARDFLFECTGRTKVNIGIMVEHKDKELQLCCSRIGTNWYEAGAIVECILDDTKQVDLVVTNPLNGVSRTISLNLADFPDRPNKTTRVGITVAYKNELQCSVTVKDLGFGELFEASGKFIRRNINIEEWL